MDHRKFLILAINRFSMNNGWLKFRVWHDCGCDASVKDCHELYTQLNPHSPIASLKNLSKLMRDVETEIRLLERYKISVHVLGEPDYPAMLAMIYDPPFVLYVRGKIISLNKPVLVLVGTRRPTASAKIQAFEMGFDLASTGCPIASGMAYGIDGAVHEGALEAGGRTWAVLAGGLDRPGPYGHRNLAEKILDNDGALIGEVYPGYFPVKYAFHKRNRILSGLSQAVTIVQAPEKSGALLTARFAMEQNRDIFVASTGLHGIMSAGTMNLHEQGAAVVKNAAEIMRELKMDNGNVYAQLRSIKKPENGLELANMMEGELNGSLNRYMGVWYAH